MYVTREGKARTDTTVEAKNRHPGSRTAAIRLLGALLVALLSTAPLAQEAGHRTVYFAGSGNAALDRHLMELLAQELGDTTSLLPIREDQVAVIENSPVVSVGPSAFSRVRQANRRAPILTMLVEKTFIDGFASRSPGRISGVLYDIPLLRQVLTGKAILPQATKVALLATTDSVELYDALIDQLPKFGMRAKVFVVDDQGQLIPTLVRALRYGDFLLAAPDDAIYNPRTIKHILLTAYRRNKIVIGPNQAYVKAGSLASSYPPFSAMAELAADALDAFFTTGEFPPPAYPDRYRIEINKQVARSLNIPLPDRDEIADLVQEALSRPGGSGDE